MNDAILSDCLSSWQYFPEDLHRFFLRQSSPLCNKFAECLPLTKFCNDIALSILLSDVVQLYNAGIPYCLKCQFLILKEHASGIIVNSGKINDFDCNIFMSMSVLAWISSILPL